MSDNNLPAPMPAEYDLSNLPLPLHKWGGAYFMSMYENPSRYEVYLWSNNPRVAHTIASDKNVADAESIAAKVNQVLTAARTFYKSTRR